MTRIALQQMYSSVVRNVMQNQTTLADLQLKLSSGNAINKLSDDPIGLVNMLDLTTELDYRNQTSDNTDNAKAYLAVVDTSLSGFDDLFQSARELALQGASDTLTSTDRLSLLEEAQQELLEMVNLADTTYKGDYIFAGTDTDKAPYSVLDGTGNITDSAVTLDTAYQIYDTSNEDDEVCRIIPGTLEIDGLEEGTDYEVDYVNGTITFLTADAQTAAAAGLDMSYQWIRRNDLDNDNGEINREIEPGVTMTINTTADDAFGNDQEVDCFSSMIALMEGLYENSQDDIETSITYLDDSIDRMTSAQASVGAKTNRISDTADRNTANITTATDLLSNIQDADLTTVLSDYALAETVYEASLEVATSVMETSLLNYL
ncbi:MAG TPA: flagellar hook-associated protein FlgL [Fibrobacteraceae bacterium]|nr:flagellar hook-associated protein FlgL [Fibrobacteraceae bacterium]